MVTTTRRMRSAVLATVLSLAGTLVGTLAGSAGAADEPNSGVALPASGRDPALEARFQAGSRLEKEGDHLAAARAWQELVRLLPDEAHLRWRIGRAYYQYARTLPLAEKDERLANFTRTLEWAKQGADLDPTCAECFLYQFVGMSRVATTRGIFSSARHAKEMAALLDQALELGPTHTDEDWNSELANLYYAAGVFYRSLPTSAVVSWTIGVRGDHQRSIEYLRKANAITSTRIDYRIELGASLLCAGAEDSNEELLVEGRQVLAQIASLPNVQPTDSLDRKAAPILASHADRACDYSRESILELE